MRFLPYALVILFALAALSCGPRKTKEERSPGEMAFRANCQTCHRLPRPSFKSDEEWPALVARYGDRAKLSEHQITIIREYLLAAN